MKKESKIKEICKKHKTWEQVFLLWLNRYPDLDIKRLAESFLLFLKHKNKIKKEINIEFAKDILDEEKYPNRIDIIETFNDILIETINKKEHNIYIKSLKTSKYKRLFTDFVEEEIHSILENGLTKELLKNQFFNKLAVYKTSKDLLKSLILFKKANTNWSKEYYKILIKETNSDLIKETETSLLIKVNDYYACNNIGSGAWCISREKDMFEMYTKPEGVLSRDQYIYIDFSLPIDNNQSMIGFTVDSLGDVHSSHLKDDKPTPTNVIKKFKFSGWSKKCLKEKLNIIKSNQEKFNFICFHNMIDVYNEYRNNKNVSINAIPFDYMAVMAKHNYKELINNILSDSKEVLRREAIYDLLTGTMEGDQLELFQILMHYVLVEKIKIEESKKYNLLKLAIKNDSINIFKKIIKKFENLNFYEKEGCIAEIVNNGSLNILEEIYPKYKNNISEKAIEIVLYGQRYGNNSPVIIDWLMNKNAISKETQLKVLKKISNKRSESQVVEKIISQYNVAIKLNKVWCSNNLTEEQFQIYKTVRTG